MHVQVDLHPRHNVALGRQITLYIRDYYIHTSKGQTTIGKVSYVRRYVTVNPKRFQEVPKV